MQISGVSLTFTCPHRLCLLRVLLGVMPLLQPFSFPSTLGKMTMQQLSQASAFIYNSHGKWVSPPLLWSFPPTASFTNFPTPDCWECVAAPAFSSQLLRDFPSPLFSAQDAQSSLLHVFFVVIAYYSVSLFFPGVGRSVQRAMLIWPRIVCRSTMYCLAHLVVCFFPSHLGTGIWQRHRSPPGFSV
jgi:hypothetical protein